MKGGVWTEYCPACGLPFELFGASPLIQNENEYQWMTEGYGIDINTKKEYELFRYNSSDGSMKTLKGKKFRITPYEEDEFNQEGCENFLCGPVIHRECMKHIILNIRRDITLEDMTIIGKNKCENRFQRGDYNWVEAEASGISFMSPREVDNICLNNIIKKFTINTINTHSAPAAGGHRKPRRLVRKTRKLNRNRKSKKQRKTRSKK
jgi:hypothetical protein